MDIISSTLNKRIRYLKSLQTKPRFRRSERRLILEGDRLIADALSSKGKPELAIYLPRRADYDLIARLQERECALHPVSEAVLRHVSDTQQAPGILVAFQLPRPPLPQSSRARADPGRGPRAGQPGRDHAHGAARAGVDLAIMAPDCVDPYNAKALRAGMGAHFRLPIVESSWKEIAAFCSDLSVFVRGACHVAPLYRSRLARSLGAHRRQRGAWNQQERAETGAQPRIDSDVRRGRIAQCRQRRRRHSI